MKIEEITKGKISNDEFCASFSNERLELILFPTEKCNFRCTYCYEDFEIGKMSKATVEGVKKFISSRIEDLKLLTLSWFGGEPLLAKDIILDISKYAYDLCKENDVIFEGGFTTNAYTLDFELFDKFAELNQNAYQISLDGWKEVHDQTRRRADGKGTFDKIWENLKSYKDCDKDFDIILRVHVNDTNYDSLLTLCQQIHKEFGNDKRFSTHFHDVRDLGGEGGKTVVSVDPREYALQIERLTNIVKGESGDMKTTAAPAGGAESASYDTSKKSDNVSDTDKINYICYASKPNSILIRANGRIGKCTVALNDDRNDIGKINDDGTLTIFNDKLAPWLRGFESMSSSELGCPWHKMEKPRETKGLIVQEKV